MITFLTGAGGVLIVNTITGFLKSYVLPRYGGIGVHIGAFAVSLILCAGYEVYSNADIASLDFVGWVKEAGMIYGSAVVLYETLLKRV